MSEALNQSLRDQEDRKRELIRLALLDEFNKGMDRGDDQSTIDTNISRLKRILENQYQVPFSMAEGGAVETSTQEILRQIAGADRLMRADGKTTKEIDDFKAQKRREMFNLQNSKPMFADGGLVEGVGSLSRVARDMFRGPRGIVTLSRFANGGEATMSPREASEHMADVEYEQQILSTADDPLVRMGLDPSVARVTNRADSYSPTRDRLNISAYSGLMSPEIQAHEFRHRGLEILLNDYIQLEPFTFRKKYGPDAWKLAQKLWEQSRLGGRPTDVADSVQEQVAELFQKPASVSRTEYYSSDGRVFHSKDAVEEYIRQNPDLEYEVNTVTRNLDDDLETPRVLEFRDYMINKNRGESPSRDPYFEGVLGFQEAASDALAGKYFGYANGGSVIASKQASVDDLANLATKIRENYGFDPVSLALEIGIDPELALRLVYQESRGKQSAGSEKGARGLTQLMPGTAEEMGVDIDDARDNFIGGMKYLKKMTDRFGLELGLAAYNAGPGNVAKYDGVPPFKETQDYLRIILEPFQGASVQPLLETGAENYLMSQPVAAEGEYSLRPRLRPQYMPTEPMLRPRLRPDEEETAQTTPYIGVIPGKRTNLFEKYGGITSLTNP